MPGRDNESPFSRGKRGKALVTSTSNLSKSETKLTAYAGPCLRPDVDGRRASVLANGFACAVNMSEAMTGAAAWSSVYHTHS